MKKILSFLALGLLLAVSCEKEGPMTVNHITDLYTAPEGATVMQLTKAEPVWALDRRYFNLDFNNLSTTLVGYDALLKPGQYVIGADQQGNAINTKVNGQSANDGFITVNEKDGQYQITATVNGKVYFWTGSLPFQPDPAPLALSEVLQAQSNKQSGVNSLTMQLATPGIHQEFDMTTYQNIWVGEGKYLALDLYSDDGYLHDGTYKASAEGGVINAGEFGIGYDTTIEYTNWDGTPATYEAKDWGTCLWTVKDGAATAEKILDGIVTVSSTEEKVDGKDVTIWTIAWGAEYPVEVVFTGAIPALTKPKKPVGPVAVDYTYTIGEPAVCSTSAGEVVSGVKKYPLTFTDKNGQEVAYLEFVLKEGATDVEEGDYVSTEYAHEAGQLANGYYLDFSAYGMGIIAGGSYYIDGGEKVYIDPGVTVTVTNVGTGAFRFTSNGFDFAAGGPNYVPGGEGGEGGDDVIVLTKFANKTDYAMFGMNMLALEFCTDGLTPTAGWFGATYEGEGNYLKLEIYAEGGALAPGTYVPNEIGTDAVDAGQFKGGYDPEGAKDYGTNWFTVAGGAATSAHITDGTVTVTQDGDNYTIVVESTAVKCKYVGPLE